MPSSDEQQVIMTAKELEETLLLIGDQLPWPSYSNSGMRATYCEMCGHEFNTKRNYERHLTTAKHGKMSGRYFAALAIARESGLYDSFRQAWTDLARLVSFEESREKHREAKAIVRSIVEYWILKNSTPETAMSHRRPPP